MKKILSLLCTLAFGLALPFYGAVDDKTPKPNYVFKLESRNIENEAFDAFKSKLTNEGMLSNKDNAAYLLVKKTALLTNTEDNTQYDPTKMNTKQVKARLVEILKGKLEETWTLEILFKPKGQNQTKGLVFFSYTLLDPKKGLMKDPDTRLRTKKGGLYHVLDEQSKDCFIVMVKGPKKDNPKIEDSKDDTNDTDDTDNDLTSRLTNGGRLNNNPKKGHYWYLFIIVPAVLGIGYYVYATFLAPEEEDMDDDGGDGDEEMDDLTEEEMGDDV